MSVQSNQNCEVEDKHRYGALRFQNAREKIRDNRSRQRDKHIKLDAHEREEQSENQRVHVANKPIPQKILH